MDTSEPYPSPVETPREYYKFTLVLLGILLMSMVLTYWRGWNVQLLFQDFMAVFFIVFASFKFINIEMFVQMYRIYDRIAQRFPAWGYLFPFVEAVLGFGYLLTNHNTGLYLVTLLITGSAAVGVWQEVRQNAQQRRRGQMMCACLGTTIQLPLSKVSFFEDFSMFFMALLMLLLR